MIDLAPATLFDEVVQNVKTILSTSKGSVPLARALGVSAVGLDDPLPSARQSLIADYVTALGTYEPRAVLTEVSFVPDGLNGRLTARVTFTIGGQVATV